MLYCHLRHMLVEIKIHEGTMRIGLLVLPTRNRRTVRPGELHALIPFLPTHRTTIDFEMNMVILDLHKGDVRRIAGLHSRPPDGERLPQFVAVRRDHTVLQQQSFIAHRKGSPRIHQLGLKVADDLKASLFADARRVGRNRRSVRHGRLSARRLRSRLGGRGGTRLPQLPWIAGLAVGKN